MKILFITLEPPFDPSLIVRGNTIRARQLILSLQQQGHDVVQVWRAPYDESEVAASEFMYQNRDELAQLIEQHQPQTVVAGYWALLEDLPEALNIPVAVDFIAPRPLEALFENTETRDTEMRRLLEALARAQGFIVANERQDHLLVPYLLMAGIDLRQYVPIVRMPIATEPPLPAAPSAPKKNWVVVGGGVDWPWRRQQRWLSAIAETAQDINDESSGEQSLSKVHLMQFGGDYPRIVQHADGRLNLPQLSEAVYRLDMTSYQDYTDFLGQQAHIGVELADENVERYFSQSFRAMDYLRHGLPMICNSYLAQADLIREYDAGWVIDTPEQLPELLRNITQDTAQWQQKSQNAQRLARERFDTHHYAPAFSTLLERLAADHASQQDEQAGGAFRFLGETQAQEENAKLNQQVADLQQKVGELSTRNQELSIQVQENQRPSFKRMLREVARRLVNRFPKVPADAEPGNVVMVTRSDLYPTDHGGAVKIIETARGLSLTGRDVGIVSDRRDVWWHYQNGELTERKIPFWLRSFSLPRNLSTLMHLSGDVPRSNAFLYMALSDDSFIWRTWYVAHKLKANVYQAEFPAYARPCILTRSLRGGKVVLVEHNVEYERLKEQEPSLTHEQYLRLRDVEVGLCNQSNAVICVSENDRRILRNDGVGRGLMHYIPHGVDLSTFDAAQARDIRKEQGWSDDTGILVYHGTYEYPPNLEAIKVMAREILPRMEQRGRKIRVLAVGKKPPPEPVHEHVHFTGSIPIVAEALKAADIAVVPLLKGGGTRMKIIDYFACGIPVISTSKGIEGIPVTSGNEAFIEDDWDEICNHIETLLDNRQRHDEVVAAARRFVEPLDWRQLAYRYVDAFKS